MGEATLESMTKAWKEEVENLGKRVTDKWLKDLRRKSEELNQTLLQRKLAYSSRSLGLRNSLRKAANLDQDLTKKEEAYFRSQDSDSESSHHKRKKSKKRRRSRSRSRSREGRPETKK